jgi:hypothetical protein
VAARQHLEEEVMDERPSAKRIWKPVMAQGADSFWLVLITSLSITVLVTRVYLELTGYPQIGGSTYHIAHVLWGGLLLFIAVTLVLSFANHYILWIAAILGGMGAGLFIDEVGKFITQSNDYFYPLAFPIIYSFILICVWLFYRIRQRKPRDTRTLLYHALEDMKQVLDNDLDPFEHRALIIELQQVVAKARDPNDYQLAKSLLNYVQSRDVRLAIQPNMIERQMDRMRKVLAGWPPRLILKIILILSFGFMAFDAAATLVLLLMTGRGSQVVRDMLLNYVIVSGTSQYEVSLPTLLLMTMSALIGVGILALVATILLVLGRDTVGVRIGVLALVITLLVVNPFASYFFQLQAMTNALAQVLLLGLASLYRWRFLFPGGSAAIPANEPVETV